MIEACKKLSDGTVVCFPIKQEVVSKKEKVDVERPRAFKFYHYLLPDN